MQHWEVLDDLAIGINFCKFHNKNDPPAIEREKISVVSASPIGGLLEWMIVRPCRSHIALWPGMVRYLDPATSAPLKATRGALTIWPCY